MLSSGTALEPQKASRNKKHALIRITESSPDSLAWWAEQYFDFEVTTVSSSQKVQRRDIGIFIRYAIEEEGQDARVTWSPRLSKSFQQSLRKELVVVKRAKGKCGFY